MRPEFVICGLGNPGEKYVFTRHNAGFLTLDMLSQRLGVKIRTLKFHALCGSADVGGVPALLMKPQTFMNESGLAVRAAMDYYKLPPERLIVVCDDVNFDPGKLRIRTKGSDGGHNGLKSVIDELQSQNFIRIRLGVGKKPPQWDLADWVLGTVPESDRENMFSAFTNACDALEMLVKGEDQAAMGKYN